MREREIRSISYTSPNCEGLTASVRIIGTSSLFAGSCFDPSSSSAAFTNRHLVMEQLD